jgi:hypothetical protein
VNQARQITRAFALRRGARLGLAPHPLAARPEAIEKCEIAAAARGSRECRVCYMTERSLVRSLVMYETCRNFDLKD